MTERASAASAKQQLDAAISDTVKGGGTKLLAIKKIVATVCVNLRSAMDNTLPIAGGDPAAQHAEEKEENMDALFESTSGMQQNDPGSNSVAAATVAMQQLSTAPKPPKQPKQQARGAAGNRSNEGGNGAKVGGKPFNLGVEGTCGRGYPPPTKGAEVGEAMEVDSGPPQAQQVCHTLTTMNL